MKFCFLRFLRFISFQLPCCSNPLSTYSVSKKRKLKEVDDGGKSLSETKDPPQTKYDVFVSFRGEDIRDGFLSHLIKAFHRKNINAFVDDQLERGDEIWPSLVEAIEGSSISLIIFSPDYASSRWCLEEVVKILDCRDKYQRIVIPVFYHVDPTSVRHQTESSKNSFAKHGKKYHPSKVQIWRDALNNSTHLAGIKSSDFRNDAEVVERVVHLLLERLPKFSVHSKGHIGIDKHMAHVEKLLSQESHRPRVIGIWGMGGIGKTTIASEVCNKLGSEYNGCCFLENVRENSSKHGIISLKKKLFSELLRKDVEMNTPYGLSNDIMRGIDGMKVLIVLDDVSDADDIENLLCEALNCLGPYSRIIVTTRDKQVLSAYEAGDIYKVGELSFDEALELFNLNAFNQRDHRKNEYRELSERVVDYASGIPLVLKVLGRLLRGKDKQVWESQLNKLKKMPDKDVYRVMRLSYDDLDHKEKKIFLDLACFFIGLAWKVTVGDIKSLLRDGESDDSVTVVFERLKDKALVTCSEDSGVSMHDIIQEMAWEIVREESREDPGSRSRLWDEDDCRKVLENDKGTEAIRSMRVFNSSLKLSPHAFAKMSKLKFLEYNGSYHCPQGLQCLSSELRYLRWFDYPQATLPQNFSAEKLVILKLSSSKIIKLWGGVQNLVNLKQVQLKFCNNLLALPDFSKATNLEALEVGHYSDLSEVHSSIFSLNKLNTLNLISCGNVATLTSDTHLSSLSYHNLYGCHGLREFSVTSENMKKLDLTETGVRALPSSFEHQSKLEILCLRESEIEELPSCMKKLTRLQYLDIRDCWRLQTIPELPPSLQTLLAGCEWRATKGQLKTVCFPRVAEQLKENRKKVEFWSRSNLDERSLMAIELNARINVMKFAHQHLSAPKHDSDDEAVYMYVYPGSRVPKWLEHRTVEDSILIDLSSTPRSPRFGFIFCFILCKHQFPYDDELVFEITVSDGNEDKGSATMCIRNPSEILDSDHVCLMYSQRCSHYLNSRATDLTTFNINVKRRRRTTRYAKPQEVLKGFGVSPINPLTCQSFSQQMEFGDSISQFH